MDQLLRYDHRIVIGDWSDDGHREKVFFKFECNRTRKEIIQAYKQAAIKADICVCGISGGPKVILDKNNILRQDDLDRLARIGITQHNLEAIGLEFDDLDDVDAICEVPEACGEVVAQLFLIMAKTQDHDLRYKFEKEDTFNCINGFWQKDFNHQIGYGIFYHS